LATACSVVSVAAQRHELEHLSAVDDGRQRKCDGDAAGEKHADGQECPPVCAKPLEQVLDRGRAAALLIPGSSQQADREHRPQHEHRERSDEGQRQQHQDDHDIGEVQQDPRSALLAEHRVRHAQPDDALAARGSA
jgi:hypothetical protein